MNIIDKYNPYKKFRPGQRQAISDMLKSWEAGNKVVTLNSPTGSGKTAMLFILGKILEHEYKLKKIIYTSPQVVLIEEGDLLGLPKLTGRRNYECIGMHGCTAEDCPFTGREDGFRVCDQCPYRLAKQQFKESDFCATTFSRYITDPNIFTETKCLFVDESSELEGMLLDKATIELDLNINDITKKKSIGDQIDDIQRFLKNFDVIKHLQKRYDILHTELLKLEKTNNTYRSEITKLDRIPGLHEIKEMKSLQMEYNKCRRKENSCNYALRCIKSNVPYVLVTEAEEIWNMMSRRKEIAPVPYFKLLDCHIPFADLITNLDCVVLASGTPTTKLLTSKYAEIIVKHPIPINQRLIHYSPVGSMNYANREQTAEKMAIRIKQLHDTYSRHTICHCNSFLVARLIMDHLARLHQNIVLQEPGYREKAFLDWQSKDDVIFLSVRYEEGISLDGPEYPMNIICKIPFPNLSDVWVQSRNKLDDSYWYRLETISRLQQACGRTTRGPDDFSETWILDQSFYYLYNSYRSYFQKWFREALIM